MRHKIKSLIDNEDKRNPLTDENIANILNTRREDITFLRKELSIEDSRNRRKVVLMKDLKSIIEKNSNINKNDITKQLNSMGYTVSRFTVIQYLKEIDSNPTNEANKENNKVHKSNSNTKSQNSIDQAFKKLIGSSGSLKSIVKLAKAAVLYPPHGLHTIIMGPTGVGKSELAECMYNFAIESNIFPEKSPFIVFNAADYSENPQLLLSQLFGHVKGAFTGADETKEGLVSKANGGILFIDEIHRLPHEGQEILFQLIDKGMARKLGETKLTNKVQVMIIAATSEPLDSHLLNTFRRRIPVAIEVPELTARPLNERFDIINNFFIIEAQRMGTPIHIKSEVLKSLMLYDCAGNVGQLRSDIQVACARGLLNQLTNSKPEVTIDISEVPSYVKQGLLKIRNSRSKIESYIEGDLFIDSDCKIELEKKMEDIYTFPDEIYKLTERRHIDLLEQGLEYDVINRIVGGELESCIQHYIKQVKKASVNKDLPDISPIVGKYIVEITQEIIKIASQKLKFLEPNLQMCLAVHLKATLERIKEGKIISNAHLKEIKENYPLEYSVAETVADHLKEKYNINLPKEEVGVIAIYFKISSKNEPKKFSKVGVLMMAHGKVASSISEVVNKLLGVNHASYLDMPFEKSPEQMMEEATELIKEIDEGKGVILLVDMGSLAYFGDIISNKTGIEIRTISRFDTLLSLEVVRKAVLPDITIDEIIQDINGVEPRVSEKIYTQGEYKTSSKKPIILTLCITGVGGAIKIKERLIANVDGIEKYVDLQTMGMLEHTDIEFEINKIRKERRIVAIIGTIDPEITGIPFLNLCDITDKSKLNYLSNMVKMSKEESVSEYDVEDLIKEENIFIDLECDSKEEVIKYLSRNLEKKGYVSKEYESKVFEREELFSTELPGEIAIPHGDGEEVLKPTVSIAILKEPIIWNEKMIKTVLLLAVNQNCFNPLSSFLSFIETADFKNIEKLKTSNLIKEMILDGAKINHK